MARDSLEKCWCTKELVEAVMTPPEGGDRVYRVCPIHGADYVWRPCELAGPELASFDEKYVRACRVGGKQGGFWKFEAIPEVCAICPVPALVEALDRAIGICQAGINTCEECPVKRPGGCMYLDARRALGAEVKP